MTAELIDRARGGDAIAFRELIAPHEAELRLHCYRMLGSLQDAEDALQEALLAAWQGLAGFEGRASVRTWLYRVATTRCLNAIRAAGRRPAAPVPPGLTPPAPTRLGEVTWLGPFPDDLLTGVPDAAPGPEAVCEARESISLAFITAIQLLPPHQRSVLLLRDVLGYPARDAAAILGVTEESITSALKRARAALRTAGDQTPENGAQGLRGVRAPAPPDAAKETHLVRRLTDAYQAGDVAAIIELFSDDAWLRMPPMPLEYQGRELIGQFLRDLSFRAGRTFRLVFTRMNGQLAFECWLPGAETPNDLLVLTLASSGADCSVAAMTRFVPLPRQVRASAGVQPVHDS